jgi:hypothetical protein
MREPRSGCAWLIAPSVTQVILATPAEDLSTTRQTKRKSSSSNTNAKCAPISRMQAQAKHLRDESALWCLMNHHIQNTPHEARYPLHQSQGNQRIKVKQGGVHVFVTTSECVLVHFLGSHINKLMHWHQSTPPSSQASCRRCKSRECAAHQKNSPAAVLAADKGRRRVFHRSHAGVAASLAASAQSSASGSRSRAQTPRGQDSIAIGYPTGSHSKRRGSAYCTKLKPGTHHTESQIICWLHCKTTIFRINSK